MKEQEIGVHCFHHRTSGDANRIAADIRSAVETLGAVGLSPVGYAAPYGRWSPALAEAVAAARFSYSSEFGFAYDDLPLECRAGTGRLLQVPVHPVCLGSLRRHSYSEDQSFAYFESVFRRAVTRRMPAFFYHHPNDGHPEVLRRLFALAREARLPMMTMQRFAGWWQDRSAWRITARLERDAVTIAAGTDVPARRIRMTTPDGREQFAAGSGSYPLAGPGWSGVPLAAPLPPDAVRARRFNPRIPLVKGLDALVGLFKRKD
jgi:hypothetical protein